ncbi:MAG: hypothetical protein K0S75_2555, partial [Clostridia bacterium]|nr:hypothetical protein [Clostridia bacterium]
MVNGKIVARDGKLMTINSEEVSKEAHRLASSIVNTERSL